MEVCAGAGAVTGAAAACGDCTSCFGNADDGTFGVFDCGWTLVAVAPAGNLVAPNAGCFGVGAAMFGVCEGVALGSGRGCGGKPGCCFAGAGLVGCVGFVDNGRFTGPGCGPTFGGDEDWTGTGPTLAEGSAR